MRKSILITAATNFELDFTISHQESYLISKLVTGIGSSNTILNLMSHLVTHQYDLILNIGIAGHFNEDLNIGEIVQVTSDIYADLGAEDPNGDFLSLSDLNLENNATFFTFKNKYVIPNIKAVKAITVNKTSGQSATIQEWTKLYHPDIETMETAAIAHLCQAMELQYLCIRSISNRVEVRNKDNWDIPLAFNNLKGFINEFL